MPSTAVPPFKFETPYVAKNVARANGLTYSGSYKAIFVRVFADEHETIKKAAADAGVSMNTYCKKRLLAK